LTIALEVDILIQKGKLGSAIKLIAAELDKIPTCKLNKVIEATDSLTSLDESVAQAHHRLDTAYQHLNQLENKLEELTK